MTIEELIEKWGDFYRIENQISDLDFQYKYTTEYLNKMTKTDKDFFTDLESVMNTSFIGDATIKLDITNNPEIELELVGLINQQNPDGIIEYFNWNDFENNCTRLDNNSNYRQGTSYLNAVLDSIKSEVKKGEEHILPMLNWKINMDTITGDNNVKGKFITDELTIGSDVRMDRDILSIPIDKTTGDPIVKDLLNSGSWITTGSINKKYLARWVEYVRQRVPIIEGEEGIDGGYTYKQVPVDREEERTQSISIITFNLQELKSIIADSIKKFKVDVVGTELILGPTQVEVNEYGNPLPVGNTLPSDDKLRNDFILKIIGDSKKQIGETLKSFEIEDDGNNKSRLTVIPYVEARNYEKSIDIINIKQR